MSRFFVLPEPEPVLSDAERGYVARGYRLPLGWTWTAVHAARSVLRMGENSVPIAVADRGAVWGRPARRGRRGLLQRLVWWRA